MISTFLGPLEILADGYKIAYQEIEQPNSARSFKVDKRYLVVIEITGNMKRIVCRIAGNGEAEVKSIIESGEALASICLESDTFHLSLGVEGDIPEINYKYLDLGMQLDIVERLENKSIALCLAWISSPRLDGANDTWFASDPSLGQRRQGDGSFVLDAEPSVVQ